MRRVNVHKTGQREDRKEYTLKERKDTGKADARDEEKCRGGKGSGREHKGRRGQDLWAQARKEV